MSKRFNKDKAEDSYSNVRNVSKVDLLEQIEHNELCTKGGHSSVKGSTTKEELLSLIGYYGVGTNLPPWMIPSCSPGKGQQAPNEMCRVIIQDTGFNSMEERKIDLDVLEAIHSGDFVESRIYQESGFDRILENGIDAIKALLIYGSYEDSTQFLAWIEFFLDPWFGYVLVPEYRDLIWRIFMLLQEAVLDGSLNINKYRAINLLNFCKDPLVLFEKALASDNSSLDEKLFAAIEDRVYLNKIFFREDRVVENVLCRSYVDSQGKEYCLKLLIDTIDADPEKLTDWYTRWIEDETKCGY